MDTYNIFLFQLGSFNCVWKRKVHSTTGSLQAVFFVYRRIKCYRDCLTLPFVEGKQYLKKQVYTNVFSQTLPLFSLCRVPPCKGEIVI